MLAHDKNTQKAMKKTERISLIQKPKQTERERKQGSRKQLRQNIDDEAKSSKRTF